MPEYHSPWDYRLGGGSIKLPRPRCKAETEEEGDRRTVQQQRQIAVVWLCVCWLAGREERQTAGTKMETANGDGEQHRVGALRIELTAIGSRLADLANTGGADVPCVRCMNPNQN